jgi:hypothetical protein
MKLSMKMFMVLLLIVGLILTIYSFAIAPDVTNCSANAQNAVRGLLVMGVALFSITGTVLAFRCHSSNSGLEPIIGMTFIVLLLLISSTTIGLVSVIHKECEAARSKTPVLLGLSILVTVVTAGYLGYEGYKLVKKPSFTPGHLGSSSPPPSDDGMSTAPSSPEAISRSPLYSSYAG